MPFKNSRIGNFVKLLYSGPKERSVHSDFQAEHPIFSRKTKFEIVFSNLFTNEKVFHFLSFFRQIKSNWLNNSGFVIRESMR